MAPLRLHASLQDGGLTVEVHNLGAAAVRLWQRDNSWGWSMFSLRLQPAAGGATHQLVAAPVRRTRNVPRALDLPAGSKLVFRFAAGDPVWTGWHPDDVWLLQPLQVGVELTIAPTPEATEQQVSAGRWQAEECLSPPPHRWLTGTR